MHRFIAGGIPQVVSVGALDMASSIERLATEPAIEEQARKFKAIRSGR